MSMNEIQMIEEQRPINVGIIGGAGYTGGELIRLILNHQNAALGFVHSRSQSGKELHSIHPDLIGETDLSFTDQLPSANNWNDLDVLFLCVGHGEAKEFLEENNIPLDVRIIDLSQDFRLLHTQSDDRNFIYGLPELNKEEIKNASHIANPGCFATALQLALLPLAKAGFLSEVYTTGITGSTGAGQSLSSTSHFSWRANNIQAYKTLNHQHLEEIFQSLHQLQSHSTEGAIQINFIPWRGDFTRGIFTSSTIACDRNIEDMNSLYEEYYEEHPFTHVSINEISLKQVVNTNKCVIYLEKMGNKLVVHSAIDNLLKGASGQAVQNMNLMFGLDECAGLNLKATAF